MSTSPLDTRNDRAKGKHLRRDPRVSVAVFDADRAYRYFDVIVRVTPRRIFDYRVSS